MRLMMKRACKLSSATVAAVLFLSGGVLGGVAPGTGGPRSVTPPPQIVPSAAATPDTGFRVKVVPGAVTVTVNAPSYREGEVIRGVVANGLDRTIYTDDLKSDCSIVLLERREGGDWREIEGCAAFRRAFTFGISPGRGREASINPRSNNFPGWVRGPAFGAGTYRIKFAYWLQPGRPPLQPSVVYSPTFAIRP